METRFLLLIIFSTFAISTLMKAVPLVCCKGKIKNKFLSSFLYYIPFAVMTCMVVPEVFNSTSSVVSAIVGVVTAVILGLLGQGMLVIVGSSTLVVFIVENFILKLF